MGTILRGKISPQAKLIEVAKKTGNAGLKFQQGTTRVLYDSLPINGDREFRFFEGSNNRDFPFTNTGASGNKLTVGEALVIERCYFAVFFIEPQTGQVSSLDSLASAGLPSIQKGELQYESANQIQIKPFPVTSMQPQFNKSSEFDDYNNFEFDTQLVLLPLLEYIWSLRIGIQAAIDDTFLQFTVEGMGAIIAPKATM